MGIPNFVPFVCFVGNFLLTDLPEFDRLDRVDQHYYVDDQAVADR